MIRRSGVVVTINVRTEQEPVYYTMPSTTSIPGPMTYYMKVELPGYQYEYDEMPEFGDCMQVLNQIMINHPELRPKEKPVDGPHSHSLSTNSPNVSHTYSTNTNSLGNFFDSTTTTGKSVDELVAQKIQEVLGDVSDNKLGEAILERAPLNVLIEEAAKRLAAMPKRPVVLKIRDKERWNWTYNDTHQWTCEGCDPDGEYSNFSTERLVDNYGPLVDPDSGRVLKSDGSLGGRG